jgi:uncharacterized membrane protein
MQAVCWNFRVSSAVKTLAEKGQRMTPEHTNLPDEPEVTHPLLSHVIERNIRTITRLRLQTAHERTVQERLADAITSFSGSMVFVYLHILWFGAWLLVNTGRVGIPPFDPFPYGLLTMIVSLEAIFLSTFVLISQNRFSDEADRRAELDLQIGLLAEHEITRVLQMLDAIQDKLGIENDADSELAETWSYLKVARKWRSPPCEPHQTWLSRHQMPARACRSSSL